MRGRPKCTATGSNVPGGESNYQRGAGAFLDGLMQDWGYGHVKDVIWDRYEVLERLPWTEGAFCSCWLTWFRGSNICIVSRWSKIANTATGKSQLEWLIVIPSANRLVMKGKRFQVLLPDDLQGEAMLGKGSEICKFWQNNFFRLVVQFSEKLREASYVGWRGYRNRNNFQNGA